MVSEWTTDVQPEMRASYDWTKLFWLDQNNDRPLSKILFWALYIVVNRYNFV